MATITLYAEESNYMPGLLQNVKKRSLITKQN